MKNIPRPQAVINDLAPIIPVVYEGLEQGTFKALEFFDGLDEAYRRPIDSHLAAYLTRFYTRIRLKEKGQEVENGEDCKEYSLKYVPNCGLYLGYQQYKIKIFKSKNGEVPTPGNSIKKQGFYEQMQLFSEIDGVEPHWNLILLWDVSAPYNLKSLSVACPQAGGRTRNSVIMHWHEPIPEAFLFGIVRPEPTKETEDEVEDLPLSLAKTEIEIEVDN